MFTTVSNKTNFPELEKKILAFWEKNNIFRQSLTRQQQSRPFIFYDGPPFATGLPHYGHLLAGTIKDIIPRYQTMKGRYVERRFGWDCHGLPVEMQMQNELGLKSTADIYTYGIDKFNESCRKIVLRYTEEWQNIVKRMGRWVDFDNCYKTMDLDFMESVIWAFKTLYDKGLIYEGYKVCPYSWKAGTTLSNFEANLNYRDVQDPAITICFKNKNKKNEYFLAWTTTPWTLIANLGLCVNPELTYCKVKDQKDKKIYYLSESRLNIYYKNQKDYEIIEKSKGTALKGMEYEPLFNYAADHINTDNCFKITNDSFVTDD
ncbi:MAG TPA: class I tRNA ligase family protein, partial [Spirochaetota bacterium]|nr:class I tRNA ligase family protein [Spirochaetota bacterium]